MKVSEMLAARAAAAEAEVAVAPPAPRRAPRRSKQTPAEVADAASLIDEITEDPSMDLFFDRDPETLTDEDLYQIIGVERQRRAAFIDKEG